MNYIEKIYLDKQADILYMVQMLKKYYYKNIFEKWDNILHELTYMDSKLDSIFSRFLNGIIKKIIKS